MGFFRPGDIASGLFGRKAHLLDDLISAGLDAPGHVASLEAWQDGVADDYARHRVGQEHAGAVAGLYAHLLLIGRDEQDHPVILTLAADPPLAPEPIAIILDRPAFEAVDGRDHQLTAGLHLERSEPRFQLRTLLGAQQSGLIDDTSRQLREGLGERGGGEAKQQRQCERGEAVPQPRLDRHAAAPLAMPASQHLSSR